MNILKFIYEIVVGKNTCHVCGRKTLTFCKCFKKHLCEKYLCEKCAEVVRRVSVAEGVKYNITCIDCLSFLRKK